MTIGRILLDAAFFHGNRTQVWKIPFGCGIMTVTMGTGGAICCLKNF